MQVVAEGAETEQEIGALSALKADFVQGYYFAKPQAAEEAIAAANAIDEKAKLGGPTRTRTWNQTVMSRQL